MRFGNFEPAPDRTSLMVGAVRAEAAVARTTRAAVASIASDKMTTNRLALRESERPTRLLHIC